MTSWQLTVEHRIAAPASKVWEALTDIEGSPHVISGIERVEMLSEAPFGVGTRWRETRRVFDKDATEELWVTAAQSAFALAVLANRKLSVREGIMLLGLFMGQFVLNGVLPGHLHDEGRIAVGIVYIVLAVVYVLRDRRAVPGLLRDGFKVPYSELVDERVAA